MCAFYDTVLKARLIASPPNEHVVFLLLRVPTSEDQEATLSLPCLTEAAIGL